MSEILCLSYDVDEYDECPVYSQLVYALGLSHFDEIKKENAVDVMDGVTVKSIKEHRSEILDVINALPSGDDIRILIKKVSGSTTLKEINLPCDMLPEIIRFSPAIRRRLTLMRILTYFN